MSLADELLKGSIDTHMHAGPNYIPRSLDMVEATREACAAGQRGIVIKDHHIPTVAAVKLVEKYHADPGFRVFGAIALNNHLGGLNLKALEIALLMDVSIVWMPTVSCDNHHVKHDVGGLKFPKSEKAERVPEEHIVLTDEQGRLKPEVVAILEMLAQRPDVVLATGHGTAAEVDAILRKAKALGCKKLIATHPAYMVDASIQQMKEWAALGAYVELCGTTSYSKSRFYTVSVERTVQIIREVGPEHIIISSDFGQMNNPRPVGGMKLWLEELIQNGIEPEAIQTMFTANTRRLLLDE